MLFPHLLNLDWISDLVLSSFIAALRIDERIQRFLFPIRNYLVGEHVQRGVAASRLELVAARENLVSTAPASMLNRVHCMILEAWDGL